MKPQASNRRIWTFRTLRGRLAALMTSVLLTFIIVQLVVYVFWYRARATGEVQANLELARAVSMAFQSLVNDVARQEMTLAEAIVAGASPELLARLLRQNASAFSDVMAFYQIDPEGRIVLSSEPLAVGIDVRDRDYFQKAMARRGMAVSDLLTDRVKGLPVFIVAYPVIDEEGAIHGVLAASIRAQTLETTLQGVRLLPEGNISLFDRQGVRVYSNQPLRQAKAKGGVDPLLKEALEGRVATGKYISSLDGTKRFGAKVPIADIGWVASASRSVRGANAMIRNPLRYTVAVMGLLITLAALAGLRVYFAITRPLRLLQEQARAIGSGAEARDVRFPSMAEFDELARGFNQAARDIARGQARRQRSLERLRRLVTASVDVLAVREREPLLKRVTMAARDVTEAASAAALLKGEPAPIRIAFPPGAYVNWDSAPQRLAESETVRLARKDENSDPLMAVRLLDADGARAGFVVVSGHEDAEFSEEDEALLRQLGTMASLALQHIQSRVDAEQRAAEAEDGRRTLEALMESVPEGIAIYDTAGHLRMMSRFGESMLERGAEALTGHADTQWATYGADGVTPMPPESMPLRRVLARGEVVRNEEILIAGGHAGPVRLLCNAGPIQSPGGGMTGCILVWSDVTEMRRFEAERMQLLGILDSTSDAVSFADADGFVRYLNAAARRLFGLAPTAPIGKWPLTQGFPQQAKEIMEQEGLPAAARDGTWQGEVSLVDRAGHELPVSLLIIAGRDSRGQPRYYSTIARDISELKAAMDALRESEELLRQAVDNYPSAFVIYDAERRIRFINRRGAEFIGLEESAILGRRDEELLPPEVTNTFLHLLQRAWATRQMQSGEASVIFRGEPHTAIMTYVPLLDSRGQLRQILGIAYEITQRKLAEEALQRVAEELARSNRDLEQFAYVASHDLQEPLRMITGYLQLIERRYTARLDDDGREFINYAVDGSHRMQTLINDLLTYSRVGTRGKPFALTDLNSVVERVMQNLDAVITETGAEIILLPLPALMADDTQMMQLFQNLLANALKFREPGRPLRIEIGARQQLREEGPYWEFWVKDNGIGIAQEYFQKIFVIFQRLHSREHFPGTGIGLALCKKIVERHQGQIWVESHVGEGSVFHFTLGSEGVLA